MRRLSAEAKQGVRKLFAAVGMETDDWVLPAEESALQRASGLLAFLPLAAEQQRCAAS